MCTKLTYKIAIFMLHKHLCDNDIYLKLKIKKA